MGSSSERVGPTGPGPETLRLIRVYREPWMCDGVVHLRRGDDMLTFIAVAVAGLALGLLAEVLRRPFGTTGAVLTAAASCAVALALWVPRSDDERALWLFLTFAGMFWLTNLFEPTDRRSPSTPR